MTQTPKQPIYKYIAIPTDEHFNPDRPSLELACRGNRTMGSILNFLVSRASYIAEKGKLESCKVVTITADRDEILKAIRISEKTFITYLKELNALHYIDSRRYARREYDINFEAINEGIKNPPAQKLRGRPKGSKRQCKSGSNKCEENTSTLQENTSTYILELENKVQTLTEKVKVLEDKVESITTFEKELQLFWKVLQLSQSDESIPQALREAFSKPLDVLDVNEITKENPHADASASRILPQETDNDTHSHHIANGATPVAVVTTRKAPVQDIPQPPSQNKLLEFPLTEPDMHGKWNDDKVVQYAEWCHNKRYAEVMRNEQLKAASAIHAKDRALTLEQYKQAHDRRFDAWWKERKNGKLHVSDMKARGSSGIDRVHEMLEQIETQPKGQAHPTGKTSSPSSDKPVKIDRKWLHEHPV